MIGDIREKIYINCAEVQSGGKVTCNMGSVLENLLLFDQFILNSVRLQELPELVRVFGFEGLKELFKTGSLKIHCEALTTGQIGQTNVEFRSKKEYYL